MVLPDRGQVGMDRPFMDAYVRHLIKTCHRRGVHAMGGMSAFIPIKDNSSKNAAAMKKIRLDKLNEVTKGHDGSWVAHPGLVQLAIDVYDEHMPTPNQIFRQRTDIVTEQELLELGPKGTITKPGLVMNISIALHYIEAWLRGVGCIPVNNLMEDAATAEISRSQVWTWIHTKSVITETKEPITAVLVSQLLDDEIEKQTGGKYAQAGAILRDLLLSDTLEEFLTLPAYPHVIYKRSSRL